MSAAPSRLPRRLAVALAAVPLVAGGLADAAIVAAHRAHPGAAQPRGVVVHTRSGSASRAAQDDAARVSALNALLARRSRAVLKHDRAAFLSTDDPRQPRLRAREARWFANLAGVPFASWSYRFDPEVPDLSNPRAGRYGDPTWAPAEFALQYRFRGFDTRPIELEQHPTFVHRSNGWYVASFHDFDAVHEHSAVDIWDFGPVQVLRTAHALVLAHPANAWLMPEVAADVGAAVPRVVDVWGSHWARRAVVLLPSTVHELAAITEDTGDLSQIAAIASAEVRTGPGRPDPVGDRVGINPANWLKLSGLGRRIVLTHELTHVATRSVTGAAEPIWLTEGIADFAAYRGTGVPVRVAASELAADVRDGRVPTRLPDQAQFAGTSKRLAQAYEGAWLACRMVAERWGLHALVRLYTIVGTSDLPSQVALDNGLRSVLHLTTAQFVARWRSYLRSQLS